MIAGINEILVEDAGVQAVLGQNAAETKYKVYPIAAPSGEALPYITTSIVSSSPTLAKGEASSLDMNSFAVHVHASSYDGIQELDDAVREALDEKQSITDAGFTFDRIIFANEYDRPELFNPDNPKYIRTLIFNAQVRRS
jgi:hypothetical protein